MVSRDEARKPEGKGNRHTAQAAVTDLERGVRQAGRRANVDSDPAKAPRRRPSKRSKTRRPG